MVVRGKNVEPDETKVSEPEPDPLGSGLVLGLVSDFRSEMSNPKPSPVESGLENGQTKTKNLNQNP